MAAVKEREQNDFEYHKMLGSVIQYGTSIQVFFVYYFKFFFKLIIKNYKQSLLKHKLNIFNLFYLKLIFFIFDIIIVSTRQI